MSMDWHAASKNANPPLLDDYTPDLTLDNIIEVFCPFVFQRACSISRPLSGFLSLYMQQSCDQNLDTALLPSAETFAFMASFHFLKEQL
jgi:hypothetical protein